MAIKTQGTDLYAINPNDGALIDVGCITSISGVDTAIEQIETTCLNAQARTYIAGLATPGDATFGIQTDPSDPNHILLHQLKTQGAMIQWAIGWSDGTAVPTVGTDSAGDDIFTLPTTRSWLTFEGYISAFPFTFDLNAVVTSEVGIQISGDPVLTPKVTTP